MVDAIVDVTTAQVHGDLDKDEQGDVQEFGDAIEKKKRVAKVDGPQKGGEGAGGGLITGQ
eukprot:8912402-Prorocentrum_lima.AAC.1